ncbi:MAG: ComEC/Rec2 family competence protein [Pirellulales bacterium]|nr:ComEC/Rec2 family competence protein [Pirellulales bacterium]
MGIGDQLEPATAESSGNPWVWWWRELLARLRRPPRAQPLVLVATVFILGIAASRALGGDYWAWWTAAAALAVVSFFIRKIGWVTFGSGALLCSIAAAGGAWQIQCWRVYPATEIGLYATELSQPIVLEAEILTAPRVAPPGLKNPLAPAAASTRTRFEISAIALRDGLSMREASGRAICQVETQLDFRLPDASPDNAAITRYQTLLSQLEPGDQVRILGFIEAIAPPLNPGEFDFAAHARGDWQLCRIKSDMLGGITIRKRAQWYWPTTWLARMRQFGNQLLWEHLSHEQAGLASAVLLGSRELLPQEQTEEFLVTGTIHILSISGLHVGLLAWGLFWGLRIGWLPRGWALFLVAALTMLYTLMTDSEPPALRATVLVWIVCLSLLIGRPGLAFNSLGLAAMIVLLLNPNDLFRTGPQLSFLSMGVLCWLADVWSGPTQYSALERLVLRLRSPLERWGMRLGLWLLFGIISGVLIWLVTLPLTMSRFYLVSPAGLFLNLALSLVVSVAMICGFLVLATGWWAPWLASLFGWLSDTALGIISHTVHLAARTPGSHFWTSGPSDAWLIGFYTLLALWAAFRYWVGWKWAGACLIVYCAAGWGEALWRREREPGLRVTFVAVGHGGGTIIEYPDGRTLLYDCGRIGAPIQAQRSVEGVLRSRGVRRLDAVIISHADTDHYNGVPELLRRFSVTQIITTEQLWQPRADGTIAPAVEILQQSIADSGALVTIVRGGMELYPGDNDIRLRVLHPPTGGVGASRTNRETDNANSLVLAIEHAGQRVLLTGDLEDTGLARMLEQPPLTAAVLQAPHHGSYGHDPEGLAKWAAPRYVIFCSGLYDVIDRTIAVYESAGAKTLHLAKVGAVRIRWTDVGLEVRGWRQEPW